MHVVSFTVSYEMIQATAHTGTFVHVFEECAISTVSFQLV